MNADRKTELACPRCSGAMRAIRVVPQLGIHAELVTFRCGTCEHVETLDRGANFQRGSGLKGNS